MIAELRLFTEPREPPLSISPVNGPHTSNHSFTTSIKIKSVFSWKEQNKLKYRSSVQQINSKGPAEIRSLCIEWPGGRRIVFRPCMGTTPSWPHFVRSKSFQAILLNKAQIQNPHQYKWKGPAHNKHHDWLKHWFARLITETRPSGSVRSPTGIHKKAPVQNRPLGLLKQGFIRLIHETHPSGSLRPWKIAPGDFLNRRLLPDLPQEFIKKAPVQGLFLWMAGELGFEPRLTESESVVLPLDDSPKKQVRVTRDEWRGFNFYSIWLNPKSCLRSLQSRIPVFYTSLVP